MRGNKEEEKKLLPKKVLCTRNPTSRPSCCRPSAMTKQAVLVCRPTEPCAGRWPLGL